VDHLAGEGEQTGSLGVGGLFGGEGGSNCIRELMALYRKPLHMVPGTGAAVPPHAAPMTACYCY